VLLAIVCVWIYGAPRTTGSSLRSWPSCQPCGPSCQLLRHYCAARSAKPAWTTSLNHICSLPNSIGSVLRHEATLTATLSTGIIMTEAGVYDNSSAATQAACRTDQTSVLKSTPWFR